MSTTFLLIKAVFPIPAVTLGVTGERPPPTPTDLEYEKTFQLSRPKKGCHN